MFKLLRSALTSRGITFDQEGPSSSFPRPVTRVVSRDDRTLMKVADEPPPEPHYGYRNNDVMGLVGGGVNSQ